MTAYSSIPAGPTRAAVSVMGWMITNVTLLYSGISSRASIASPTAGTAITSLATGSIDIDPNNKIGHLNSHIATVATALSVSATRARQTGAAWQPIPGVVVAIPMVLA